MEFYDTIDDCARAMLTECTLLGKDEHRHNVKERGGDIKKSEEGYYYDDIQTGIPNKVAYRVSKDAVAALHTHPPGGSWWINKRNEKLSRHDKTAMIEAINEFTGLRLPHYLGTPSGRIRKFEYGKYNSRGIVIEGRGYLKFR